MAQFASTLYPQTNPTNSILLAFRDDVEGYDSLIEAVHSWLTFWRDLTLWDRHFQHANPRAVSHAHRVLTRLASLSG